MVGFTGTYTELIATPGPFLLDYDDGVACWRDCGGNLVEVKREAEFDPLMAIVFRLPLIVIEGERWRFVDRDSEEGRALLAADD